MHSYGPRCVKAFAGLTSRNCASRCAAARRWVSQDVSPADDGLIYPDTTNALHHDLASFLSHAERAGLNRTSTVYIGTLYEYTIAASLARYGFRLKRIGGAGDFGTDLLGTWTPPSASQTLKVLVQCKAGTQKIGPQHVRELEGAFAGAPVGWRGNHVLAFLISQRDATKGVRDALGRSKLPMGYLACSGAGKLRQMLWNQRAAHEGLEGFGVTTRHGGDGEEELALQFDGKTLPFLDVEQ